MRALKTLVASTLLAVAVPSFAEPLTIDFETVPSGINAIGDTYDGFHFTANAWSIIASGQGGLGNFTGAPTPIGALFLSADPLQPGGPGDDPESVSFVINVDQGFTESFGLWYTSTALGFGRVQVFSGANGSGDSLGAFDLTPRPACIQAPTLVCNWLESSVGFTGTAFSIVVSGADSQFYFDNLRFGNLLDDGGNVPEPGGVALSLAALGALAWTRKRRG